jgi:hypothetical protein
MPEFKHMCACFLCKREFQFGPHRYDGRRIPTWDIMVCDTCYQGNHDGIVPNTYPHLPEYLRSLAITIQTNDKGWIPFPS